MKKVSEENRRILADCAVAIAAVFLALFVVQSFTGQWLTKSNPYNSYTLQALSWLDGRLDLPLDVPHLELAIYQGKYYVSFPPFPSYVMLPFAAIFGQNTPDSLIAMIVTLVGVIYAIRLGHMLGCGNSSLFWVLFAYLSTGFCFVDVNGYVWFIAQNMGMTLSFMALFYCKKGRGCLGLTFWAFSVGCRPMLALFVPYLLHLLYDSQKFLSENSGKSPAEIVLHKIWWSIGPCVVAASYMVLNYLRFGSVLEFGHKYLPEFQRAEHGQFSLHYVSGNLKNLLRLPVFSSSSAPLQFNTENGWCFLVVIPLFISAIICLIYGIVKSKGTIFEKLVLPLSVAAYIFILLCHRTMGGWHFGNRYLLDTLPYILCLVFSLKPEKEYSWLEKCSVPLMLFGMVLNMVGTIATYNRWI